MTKQKKLEAIIEYAVSRGWEGEPNLDMIDRLFRVSAYPYGFVYKTLFSHDFAKAVFGEEEICYGCKESTEKNYDDGMCKNCCKNAAHDENVGDMDFDSAWKVYLQQAVIADDKIDYYFEYVKKKK